MKISTLILMKSLKTCCFIAILLLVLTNCLNAQVKFKISGKVIDDKQRPVEFATVNLLKTSDSSIIKTTLTKETGEYKLESTDKGSFVVSVTAVGYKRNLSKEITLIGEAEIKVSEIILISGSQNLKEVTITAKKPFVERRADKMIVNVEGSSVAVGNTALEVLQKAPGVNVDKDGNISLNGKNGVLLMRTESLLT